MTTLIVALLVANLLIAIGALVAVLSRRPATPAASGASELRADLSAQRSELNEEMRRDRDERRVDGQNLRDALAQSSSDLLARLVEHQVSIRDESGKLRNGLVEQLEALRRENEAKLEKVRESVDEKLRLTLTTSLKENADRIDVLTRVNAEKITDLQASLRVELDKLREGNEAKLEKMRETVDEKLQGTLEKRLGESFTLVSTRLEEVQKGLGEMHSLAADVGGLKRVLTNVKNRGGWGEVQLSRQLEDILTADQYGENISVRPGSNERVEFAIRLPGRDNDERPVYLPIDSKLPHEDYERLLDAQESGDAMALDIAGKALERAIVEQAKVIASKYIEPPYTTDFAIMYLPTEGLFAEVIRRPGLANRLQSDHRVLVTGPTTLMSVLNSLQVGFRSIAIEKRTSEVWRILGAAKSEFQKYGKVWDTLDKQLATAQRTVGAVSVRTRAIERSLRNVELADASLLGIDQDDTSTNLRDAPELPEFPESVPSSESTEDDGI